MRQFILFLLIAALFAPLYAGDHGATISREQALADLRAGNERYVSAQPHTWSANAARREELAKGQHPKACIITCSDSRVPPELLFDQGLGELFVVRLAGNVVSPEAAGSVEYAVEHLQVPVVVVLGHTSCGAVSAALASEGAVEGPIGTLITRIKPAIQAAKEKGFSGDELASASVSENARRGAEALLQSSRVVDESVQRGDVAVLSAVYDLKSGKVNWQTQLTAPVSVAPVAASAPAPAEKKEAKEAAATEKPVVKPVKAPQAEAHAAAPEKKSTMDFETYARRH